MKRKYLLFALTLSASRVFACVASENIDLYFARNSTQLSNSEVLRLAHWVADQKIAYARNQIDDATALSGNAESTEHDAKTIANTRTMLGERLLMNMGFTKVPIRTSSHVYKPDDVDNGRRIEISFEPQCPNKCCK
jgi:hypothetical protein